MNKSPHQLHFALTLLFSFLIFNSSFILDQTLRWTNHYQGFVNGIFHLPLFGIAWGFYFIPWSCIIFGLYRWRKWRRFRALWILAPAILACSAIVAGLLLQPPSCRNRFYSSTKVYLPTNTTNLQYSFSGGGIADYYDIYYFETSSAEVSRLIRQMKLKKSCDIDSQTHIPIHRPDTSSWPDYNNWNSAVLFRSDTNTGWFYDLITNGSSNKVYIVVGCF